MRQLRHFIKGDKASKNFKCSHCGQDLGRVDMEHDEYDLMKSHIYSCPGKEAKAFRKAKDAERWGEDVE